MIYINYGGKSCSILFIESKFERSFYLNSIFYSSVILSPIFFLLFLERWRKIKGKY